MGRERAAPRADAAPWRTMRSPRRTSMTDTILKELQGLNRPFKYVVTTIIMQKNGAGMDTGAAMHWDANKDGLVCIPWENAEMHVVLTIYGVSLNVDNVGDEED